ncbi:hypothetical protein CEXT_727281 [Caerostris extrusa]|uniref:LAGLIDADG homing endonuclease n=1 Tax=Caerostris extrusa TaxID=172846 RepID=A0AAV4X8Q8_CAEEX|nr:hypothetical protein CEXT_727281 [Caerostris extrusa]
MAAAAKGRIAISFLCQIKRGLHPFKDHPPPYSPDGGFFKGADTWVQRQYLEGCFFRMKDLPYDSSNNETLLTLFAACLFMEAKGTRFAFILFFDGDRRPGIIIKEGSANRIEFFMTNSFCLQKDAFGSESNLSYKLEEDTNQLIVYDITGNLINNDLKTAKNGKKRRKRQQQLKTELQYQFFAEKRSGSILSKDHPPLIARKGSSLRVLTRVCNVNIEKGASFGLKAWPHDSSSNEILLALFAVCIFMEAKRYKTGLLFYAFMGTTLGYYNRRRLSK